MNRLNNKYPNRVAFITGGADGLGLCLAEELARLGWTIGMTDIDEGKLYHAAARIQQLGGTPRVYHFDVADANAYQRAAEDFLQEFTWIDLLVNNAGVGDASYFEDYSLENWEWMVGVNQMGVVHGIHFFMRKMRMQRSGHIVIISSAAAFSNMPAMSAYNCTKAAVLALGETLRKEVQSLGIGVTVALPLFFRTNIAQYARGPKELTHLAHRFVNSSNLTPQKVARRLLNGISKNEFLVYGNLPSRLLHLSKRLFPNTVSNIMQFLHKNSDVWKEYLIKKENESDS
ncbi:MAG: SDR family NAD(P)-dependent oxidoreductase [Saprospiraceae bacterium]|nr:SDR family NAD(P)-dependent oxidoreductase [Saprospiraceae bacterium]